MKFSLIVVTSPDESRACHRALQFAAALNQAGHALQQVFFYANGASIGLNHHEHSDWHNLAQATQAELILCSASAEHFGLGASLNGFSIAGLGAMVEAGLSAERVVTFG